MSDAIFPTFIGQSWPVTKSPAYKTLIQTSVSGKEKRIALQSYPRWTFGISFNYLSDDGTPNCDVQKLSGFILSRQGSFDDFLFAADPFFFSDNVANDQSFGVGDGITTQFQLVRNYGGYIEPVTGIIEAPVIKKSGVATTAFIFSTYGVITFATAPAAGEVLKWSGKFYYRVRFTEDSIDLENDMYRIWSSQSVGLITVK